MAKPVSLVAGQSVPICSPDRNILTAMGWMGIKFVADISGLKRMKSKEYTDLSSSVIMRLTVFVFSEMSGNLVDKFP